VASHPSPLTAPSVEVAGAVSILVTRTIPVKAGLAERTESKRGGACRATSTEPLTVPVSDFRKSH